MPTIQEFIQSEMGKPNKSPKHLILEAYALGVSHGEGEDYQPVPEAPDNSELAVDEIEDADDEENVPHTIPDSD
tara:strand:- start:1442 stop:1663 length:222 start_codon:yes stop_codon:yes gene_type:complete